MRPLSEAHSAIVAQQIMDQVGWDDIQTSDELFESFDSYENALTARKMQARLQKRRAARRKRNLLRTVAGAAALATACGAGYIVVDSRETHAERLKDAGSVVSTLNDQLEEHGFGSIGQPGNANVDLYPSVEVDRSYLLPGEGSGTLELKLPGCILHSVDVEYQTNATADAVTDITSFIVRDVHYQPHVFVDYVDIQEQTNNQACDLQKLNTK